MSELSEHYRLLLGLDAAWQVDGVHLALEDRKVEIDVSHRGGTLACPECSGPSPQPFVASSKEHAPQAEIVHDKFHVSKHLNEAVDQVRRRENKALRAAGDERLVGSKQLWLFSPANLSKERKKELDALRQETLKTSRAWAIKEHFRRFWDYVYPTSAADFFRDWYGWAVRSQLPPIRDKAKMLKRHLNSLLSYFRHPITNAVSEGFNSRIQAIKSAARGFRNFDNYRTRILFYCGKLDLKPVLASH